MIDDRSYVVGADIGGTNVRLGLFNPVVGLKEFRTYHTRDVQNDKRTSSNIVRLVRDYLYEVRPNHNVVAISLGFPSVLDKERRHIVATTNISGLDDIPIVDIAEAETGLPTFIEKDTNLLLRHDISEDRNLANGITIGYYLGTGLGNAISINGEILIGRHGAAGELGHIPTRDLDGVCGCGNRSCIELVASGVSLQSLSTRLGNEYIGAVFDNHVASPEIEAFLRDISIPLATEVNILDPDHVILGGGVFQMSNFPREKFESHVRALTRSPYPADSFELKYSIESQRNGVIGAGLHAFDNMKDYK